MGWGSTNWALEDEEHTAGVAIALGEEQVNVGNTPGHTQSCSDM